MLNLLAPNGWGKPASQTPTPQPTNGVVGVSTPCGAASTRGITVFVPSILELYIYEMISDPEVGPCPPRVALALRIPGWGFHTVRGGIDPGDHRFRPRFAGAADVRKDPRMQSYPPRMPLTLRNQVGVSTPCGAISTRGTNVFVPSWLEL